MRSIRKIKKKIRDIRFYLRYGFSRGDLWNLDQSIAAYVLPRLRVFREIEGDNYEEDALQELDDMIFAFEQTEKGGWDIDFRLSEEERERVKRGYRAFAEKIHTLWI
jgi:hypothetical protein